MSMANYGGDQSRRFTYKYDVFLSFTGEDMQHSFREDDHFIEHLYDALRQRGINVCGRGEVISTAFLKAIKESKISVIVFTENYARYSWCLDELVESIECTKRNNNQIVFPIFYRVDRDDVLHQRSSYGQAMIDHENRLGEDSEKIKAWKAALSEAANIEGYDIDTAYKIDQIKDIVEKVEAKLAPQTQTSQKLLNADNIWKLAGVVSSVVGLSCYALSPSFSRLFPTWKLFKFIPFGVLSLVLITTIFFAKKLPSIAKKLPSIAKKPPSSKWYGQPKTYLNFAVLMIMSVYTFYYDRAVNGKPDILNVFSNAAFAVVSLSLHKLFGIGSEIGVFTYFLSCFTVQLFTIKQIYIIIAIIVGCPLFVIHSSPNSQPEVDSGGRPSSPNSQPEVDSGGQVSHSSSNSGLVSRSDGQHVDIESQL